MGQRRITCLVMAGGRGRRLRLGEPKPLAAVCGKPMLQRVVETLSKVCSHVVVALSPYTLNAASRRLCETSPANVDCVLTSGAGYVEDLSLLLRSLPKPLLVAPADTPLLTPATLEAFMGAAEGLKGVSVVSLSTRRGLVGLSLFRGEGGPWATVELDSDELLDVDTPGDLEEARRLCTRLDGLEGEPEGGEQE